MNCVEGTFTSLRGADTNAADRDATLLPRMSSMDSLRYINWLELVFGLVYKSFLRSWYGIGCFGAGVWCVVGALAFGSRARWLGVTHEVQ